MVVSRYARHAGRASLYRGASWAGKKIGGAVGRYAANQYNKSRSTNSRRSPESSSAVTFQHDAATTYRRRRAPRRVRRAAAKSYNRFVRNESKSLGMISRTFPHTFASGVITPSGLDNSQFAYSDGLYGGIPNSVNWGNLYAIASAEAMLTKSGKIFFRSAVQNTQVRNAGTEVLCADVYEVIARKEGYNEPDADWALALAATGTAAGTGAITHNTLGCTPFDASGFGSSWLIKKKTTYRISPGNSVYLQMRNARRFVFETERFEYDTPSTAVRNRMFKGMSQGYLIVMRSADPVAGGYMGPVSYEIVTTKTYHYSVNAYAEDLSGYQ